jgi:hypothetical protein
VRETQAGLVYGSADRSNYNANIGTHLDHENFRTVVQNNAVGGGRDATLPFPQPEGSWERHVPLSQTSRVDRGDTAAWEATALASLEGAGAGL